MRPTGGLRSMVKRALRRLQHSSSRKAERSSELARLLDGLGQAYGGGFAGPVLLEMTSARVTLVPEPGLPTEAIRLAEQIVTIRGQDMSHRPLRWNGELRQWVPLDEAWSEQAALRKLATEIQAKLPLPRAASNRR